MLREQLRACSDEDVLHHGKIILHAVAVADIAELAPEILSRLENRFAAPEDLTFGRPHQSRQETQKRGFSRPV